MKLFSLVTSSILLTSTFTQFAFAATANTADPTAQQVTQGLLNVYGTQQVWPKGLQVPPNDNGGVNFSGSWANNVTPTPANQWVGLSTVFPGDPASKYTQDLGMNYVSANKPITAGTLAQWVLNWEVAARHLRLLQFQPTKNAFALMNDYSLFYHTNFKNSQTVVTTRDLEAVETNLKAIDQGYRILTSNKVELLMPMVPIDIPHSIAGGTIAPADYGVKALAPLLKGFDSITFTFLPNGNVLYSHSTANGVRYFLDSVFVTNNVVTGNVANFWGASSSPTVKWMQTHSVPRILNKDGGQYLGQKYSGIGNTVPNIKNTFFVASFNATFANVAAKNGDVNLMVTPSYVISKTGNHIQYVEVYNNESFPAFCQQME